MSFGDSGDQVQLGRFTFNTHHFLRSSLSLCLVVVAALHAGGSVPNEFRRYLVTPQDAPSQLLEQAIIESAPEDWQAVGTYAMQHKITGALHAHERRSLLRAQAHNISLANDEAAIRSRIRVPLLPGPVVAVAGPLQKRPEAARPVAPASPAPIATKSTAPVNNTPAMPLASPLAEDLATIEALKAALQDLKKEGIALGTYRNDIADK